MNNDIMPKSEFRIELEQLLNRHSMENGCDSPDFILAKFLVSALDNFNAAVNEREEWYGRQKHLSDIPEAINIPDINLEPSTTEPLIDLDSTGKAPYLKQSKTDETYRICSGADWKGAFDCHYPTGMKSKDPNSYEENK